MDHDDYYMTAQTTYREAEGEPRAGQIGVAYNIKNRATKHGTKPYDEATKHLQFSGNTLKGDPRLIVYGKTLEPIWEQCKIISTNVLDGTLNDPTDGADLYYNPDAIQTNQSITLPDGRVIPFPQGWNPDDVEFKIQIGKHYFFKEISL